ncbi:MAG: hypothetical protein R2851_21065 [Caldilineaceae bacterium]
MTSARVAWNSRWCWSTPPHVDSATPTWLSLEADLLLLHGEQLWVQRCACGRHLRQP